MIRARQCKKASVRVLNDIGILAQLIRILADQGVNIRAAAARVQDENKGSVRRVTDDNLRAVDALRIHNYDPEKTDAIEITTAHSAGMLGSICSAIGNEGINMRCLYAGAPLSDETCLVILATENNNRALVLLNE